MEYRNTLITYLASLHLFTKSILPSSQNKCSFRSWARELRWGKKSRVHMKREGVEKKRDRDRVVLESKNYTYFGTNFES